MTESIATLDSQLRQAERIAYLEKALRYIASIGGNLPNEALTTRTGANDAAYRGSMYCEARRAAREALKVSVAA